MPQMSESDDTKLQEYCLKKMSLSTSMCILDYNRSHMHWEVPMLSCAMFTSKVFVLVIKVS